MSDEEMQELEGKPEEELQEAATLAEEGDQPTEQGEEAPTTQLDPLLSKAGERAGLGAEDIQALGDNAESVLAKLKKGQDEISARLGKIGQQALGQQGTPQTGAAPAVQQQPQAAAPRPEQAVMGTQRQQEQPQPGPQVSGQQTQQQADLSGLQPLPEPDSDELETVAGSGFAEAFENMRQRLNAITQSQQQVAPLVEQYHRQITAQQQREAIREADGFFSELSGKYDGYAEEYGRGETAKLIQGSPEFNSRLQIMRQAGAIRTGAMQQGMEMSVREALERAHSVLAPELRQQAAREQATEEMRGEQKKIISRPTSRREIARRGIPDATEAVRQKEAELGMT